jgi:putative transport protein
MEILFEQLRAYPFLTLFLSLGIGYLVGRIRFGKFQLGGIAGTLIAAVLIGQIGGIKISQDVQNIFFALFIFMVGYLGGPQFLASLNRSAFTRLLAAVSMTVLGLLCVLGLSIWAGLDKGLAAGLAAGGLTQSAIIGTAGDAINQLGLSSDVIQRLKTNVAVGYSVTYIFGSLGPILMITIIPIIYRWDLRKEAVALAEKMGGGTKQLEQGEFFPLNRVSSRAFTLSPDSEFVGRSAHDLESAFDSDLAVEEVFRDNESIAPTADMQIRAGDIVVLSGLVSAMARLGNSLGAELGEFDDTLSFAEERRTVVITNRAINGLTLKELHDKAAEEQRHGVYVSEIQRMTHRLPTLPGTELRVGDELSLVGRPLDMDRMTKFIGYQAPLPSVTEYTTFGLGMVVGYIIGEISFSIWGASVTLGSGLGCLISGLIVGYLRSRHPKLGGVNMGAANFLQTFGLAVFVGVVGLNAGAPALEAIKEHGLTLLLLGVVATMVPQIVQFCINYYVLKIRNPVEAMAVIAGSRSGNPAFATLLEKTGNSTPTPSFTMTYAVANIFLTLWGPIVVALVPGT